MSHNTFEFGSRWLKADFHLHTRADEEFDYRGEDNDYLNDYVHGLRNAGIGLGVIANHNKFDREEFKALRKKAKKFGIGLLPGIELSVKDGQSGVHTIVVFSEKWYANREQTNHVQSFLNLTFAGVANFEDENTHSTTSLKRCAN